MQFNLVQQIDLGEETGPRTVVSGLVNYIPIEEMRDKYLVAIVSVTRFITYYSRPAAHLTSLSAT
jgi:tRNA-binding EMAP/Myf-like protein